MAHGVVLHAFDGMGQSVAVIERLAQPCFQAVLTHNVRLDLDRPCDDLREDVTPWARCPANISQVRMGAKQGQYLWVTYQAGLQHLR